MTTMKAVTYACEFCGKQWRAETQVPGSSTGWTGWLVATVDMHRTRCRKQTPAERLATAKRALQYRKSRPPRHTTVIDNFRHPGMKTK